VSRRPVLSRIGLVLITVGAVGAVAGPAQAAASGTVRVLSSTVLEYTAASGKANTLLIGVNGTTVTIDDSVKLKAGAGCAAVSGQSTVVTCVLDDPSSMTVNLGDRNDRLSTTSALNLTVFGGTGDDVLTGGAGVDRLHGGAGKDKVAGGGNRNTLYGDAGNDRLEGGPDGDILLGGVGNDTLLGRGDRDWLDGGAGNDVSWGGAGHDALGDNVVVDTGADVFHGGAGIDQVTYRMHTAAVMADLDGKRDDGQRGEKDTIATDVEDIEGTPAGDRLTGNAADNELSGGSGQNVLSGGAGNDRLLSWDGKDALYGQAGNDELLSAGGADIADGGPGNDTVYAGDGADTLYGGTGNDHLEGDYGVDKVFGGAGDDELYSGWTRWPGTDQEPGDALDGGSNTTSVGDLCVIGDGDSQVSCER
jgi:serralysin